MSFCLLVLFNLYLLKLKHWKLIRWKIHPRQSTWCPACANWFDILLRMFVAISGSLFSFGVRLATLKDRLLGNFFTRLLLGVFPGEPARLSRACKFWCLCKFLEWYVNFWWAPRQMKPPGPQEGWHTLRQWSRRMPRILSRCFRFLCGSSAPPWAPGPGWPGSPARPSCPGRGRPAGESLTQMSQGGESLTGRRHSQGGRQPYQQEGLTHGRSGCALDEQAREAKRDQLRQSRVGLPCFLAGLPRPLLSFFSSNISMSTLNWPSSRFFEASRHCVSFLQALRNLAIPWVCDMQTMKMMVNGKHLANGLLYPDLVSEIFFQDAWRSSHL